jgi:hypothetical protein
MIHLLLHLPTVLFSSRFLTKMYLIHPMHATYLTNLIHHDLICLTIIGAKHKFITLQCLVFQVLSIALILFESTFRNLSVNIMHGHWCRFSCLWLDTLTPTTYTSCVWCPETGTHSIDSARAGYFAWRRRQSSVSVKFQTKLRSWIIYRLLIIVLICGILVGKLEGKRQLERSRHRWEDNIKINLREIGWCDMDWSDLAWENFWAQ